MVAGKGRKQTMNTVEVELQLDLVPLIHLEWKIKLQSKVMLEII
jgi:hypothetical protein